ncbi:hypothetical protein C8J57DRAFT_1514021 [Mycena rebaudengoi]|nr:hypothetical protein C8J57DRAFT_1514021 [Mycena rebaudengoi]
MNGVKRSLEKGDKSADLGTPRQSLCLGAQGTQCQAWTSGDCRAGAINTASAGTGNRCFVGAGLTKAGSAAWTHAASKRASVPVEYVTPDTFSYTVEGLARTIKLPSGSDAVDAVVSLYRAGNFTALGEYEATE